MDPEPSPEPSAPQEQGPSRLRDLRRRDWFWIDNVFIEQYARSIGPIGVTLYVTLARFAGRRSEAFPSLRYLESLLGISRPSLVKYLNILEEHGLIRITPRTSKEGDNTSNLYELLSINDAEENDGGGKGRLPPSKGDLPPGQRRLPRVVNDVYHGGKGGLPEEDLSYKDPQEEDPSPTPPTGKGGISDDAVAEDEGSADALQPSLEQQIIDLQKGMRSKTPGSALHQLDEEELARLQARLAALTSAPAAQAPSAQEG
jgi:hypothetical protein